MMLYGDYWPLTPYSLESDDWIAWQFNRESVGDGCIQAFRREDCGKNQITVKLRGLDAETIYQIRDFDNRKIKKVSGKILMNEGLQITLMQQPGSALFVYEKIRK